MQSDNPLRQSDTPSSPFHTKVRIVWAVLCGVSIAILLLYRSAPGHGPDMIGKEMTAFLAPLLLAFFVSAVYLLAPIADGHSRGKLFLYTTLLAVTELILYGTVLMP